jgi:hypothetical protein
MKTFRFKHDDSCQDYNGDDSGNLSSNAKRVYTDSDDSPRTVMRP